jgi:hypothetical protein
MSESPAPRRILHVVLEGFPAERLKELSEAPSGRSDVTEIFHLTQANAQEALGKIFAADTIAVWGKI